MEEKYDVIPVGIKYICDEENCSGEVKFLKSVKVPPKIVVAQNQPPQILHKHVCMLCGKEYLFKKTYPSVRFKPKGDD